MENNAQKINWYPGHMAKTKRLIKDNLTLIDVVLELVDARIPFSSKINDLNDLVKNKPRILVVTKYDLCDQNVTDKWLKYYENLGYIVIPVNLKNNLDYKKIIKEIEDLSLSINERRKSKDLLDKEINALVIGVPNVGKSTLINTLAGKRSQNVENRPGVTKELVWLKTKHNIKILDTPGLLWPKLETNIAFNLAATTAIKEEVLPIIDVANHILEFLFSNYPEILFTRYKLKPNTSNDDLFFEIAKHIGAIKNDEIDYERVSMRVINDIRSERITGITFDKYD